MVDEARLEQTDNGKVPTTDGWFVVHTSEAPWFDSDRYGMWCRFGGPQGFPDVGINLSVLEPGKPACLYHRESAQEDFFVLSGECILVVEEEERQLRAGDFVHCPPGTNHVFVGDGKGLSAILMIGHRPDSNELCYPVSEAAAKYGGSVEIETTNPREAYGDRQLEAGKPVWPLF